MGYTSVEAEVRRRVAAYFTTTEPATGLWCENCALPSLIQFDLLHLDSSGLDLVMSVRTCTNPAHEGEHMSLAPGHGGGTAAGGVPTHPPHPDRTPTDQSPQPPS